MTPAVPEFIDADWHDVAGVRAFASTRTPAPPGLTDYGDFNLGLHVGDDSKAVSLNRERLLQAAGLASAPSWLDQVHGNRLVHADSIGVPAQADAAWTAMPGVVCAVLTADCLPVVFAERRGRMIAVAHAGWRGLAAGVLEATLEPFRNAGIAGVDIRAWFGPAIGPAAYEVDAPVRDACLRTTGAGAACFRASRPGHWYCDLYGLARARLREAGIEAVSGGSLCTYSDHRFYSYRRTERCGRQATIVYIEGN